ncbi:MAG: response regulator, partial [Verrucomicrobia bacterium]|nr:response regulator [Verrucomicrobiota bacterium]
APQLNQLTIAAERATNLTWQLLSLSRKQGATDSVDLNQLINEVAALLQHVLKPDIALDLKLADGLPAIPAHRVMLEQVLLNLVIHARYAMPRGGRLEIETRLSDIDRSFVQQEPEARIGRHLCLRVADTGGGVNAARVGCLHEPFFTTKNVGQQTGLGLATVHGIVKQHQGWISVSDSLGQGTTFRVYLPVNPAKTDAPAAEWPHQPICGGTETILLAEGEPLLRVLARSILQRYGYQVLEAGSGAEALAVWELHAGEVTLLLTDLGTPGGVNGLELAQQLQSKAAKLKVLYTSGHSASLAQSNCPLKTGVNFLPKPYSATALAQAVRNCLDRVNTGGGTDARQATTLVMKR